VEQLAPHVPTDERLFEFALGSAGRILANASGCGPEIVTGPQALLCWSERLRTSADCPISSHCPGVCHAVLYRRFLAARRRAESWLSSHRPGRADSQVDAGPDICNLLKEQLALLDCVADSQPLDAQLVQEPERNCLAAALLETSQIERRLHDALKPWARPNSP